ncbi:unnamed protein product [Prunus armeniaca]
MELSEIEDLPKKLLREEAGRAFRLQASASMDMWLCVKRAINAAEKAKKAYEDGRAKVKVYQAKLGEMSAALEAAQLTAKEALESKEAGFRDRGCRSGGDSGLPSVYRVFYLAGQGGRLGNGGPTLPFQAVQPWEEAQPQLHCRSPPFPEGITEEMVEEYEGEDMTEEVPADPEGGAAEADGAAPDADEAAA